MSDEVKKKHAGGRPVTWTPEKRAELLALFFEYIDNTDLPIVCEFAAQNGLYKDWFRDKEEFERPIKDCLTKKEAALERMLYSKDYPASGVIFSLKQLGWRDTQSIDMAGSVKVQVEYV